MKKSTRLSPPEEAARAAWYAYIATHELPPDIPRDPDKAYAKEGWKGWCDWIGTNIPPEKPFTLNTLDNDGLHDGAAKLIDWFQARGNTPFDALDIMIIGINLVIHELVDTKEEAARYQRYVKRETDAMTFHLLGSENDTQQ